MGEHDRRARPDAGRDRRGGDNAYNTAMALATTEAARLAIKVLKATSGVFSLVGQARRLACRVFRD